MSTLEEGTERPATTDGPIVLLLTDSAHRTHTWPGHPERPERVDAVAAGVRDGTRSARVTLSERGAEPISVDQAASIHERGYLDWLAAREVDGGGWLDPDTYVVPGSWNAARVAAGMAVAAVEAVHAGEATVAFAAGRPPGHHAGRARGKGFCIMNNIAIAVGAFRGGTGGERIAVLDWDVHHGDGSEEIFSGEANILYASTHQYPWYPGTGAAEGSASNVLNVPLPAETGDDGFVRAWRDTILPRVESFQPAAIVVSAGYDAHLDDPLAWLEVTAEGFRRVSEAVGECARALGLPGVALTLEGGYDLDALRASAAATVIGLLAGLRGASPRDAGE
jgi:acetoin utilization deacetylase AcuC-like enzyme